MNLFLAQEHNTLPYRTCLREFFGSITSCILFEQLERRFQYDSNGFYKFLDKSSNSLGDDERTSWCSELCFSKQEFLKAFDNIGVRYKTEEEFQLAIEEDHVFVKNKKEYYYCSYIEDSGRTFYQSNYELIEPIYQKMYGMGRPYYGNAYIPIIKRKNDNGYVYLFSMDSNKYKIGISTNPAKRIKSINAANPEHVELIHTIPTDNMEQLELMLHEHFKDKRLNGEWFGLDDNDVATIVNIKSFNNNSFICC